MGSLETRRYRILGILGEGGHGKVYRARLQAGSGFTKDVAIKMLRDAEPSDELLRRFRDEARILGLLRDRAIVSVDPPTQLGGRWAVVMEFVDGLSGQQLVDRLGTVPVAPALGIIAEAARVLDKTWSHPGPDGEPLRLLHRDIKPANLQVTSSGEVKLLDFGVARAQFQEREAATTRHVMGTPGYIAPERVFGADTPAGDVYSLGTTLHVLLFGGIPEKVPAPSDAEGVLAEVIALIEATRVLVHDERPSARDVERSCTELLRRATGPSLRDWAESSVPATVELAEDARSGEVLTEALSETMQPTDGASVAPSARLALVGAALLGFSATIGGAMLLWSPAPPPDAPSSTAEERPTDAPPATEGVMKIAEPAPEPSAEDDPAKPPPVPSSEPSRTTPPPAPGSEPEPPIRVADPAVEPVEEPEQPAWPVTIASVPVGAFVTLDGNPLGNTPIIRGMVPAGAHELSLTMGELVHTATIEAGRNRPQRYVWRVADDDWQVEY